MGIGKHLQENFNLFVEDLESGEEFNSVWWKKGIWICLLLGYASDMIPMASRMGKGLSLYRKIGHLISKKYKPKSFWSKTAEKNVLLDNKPDDKVSHN